MRHASSLFKRIYMKDIFRTHTSKDQWLVNLFPVDAPTYSYQNIIMVLKNNDICIFNEAYGPYAEIIENITDTLENLTHYLVENEEVNEAFILFVYKIRRDRYSFSIKIQNLLNHCEAVSHFDSLEGIQSWMESRIPHGITLWEKSLEMRIVAINNESYAFQKAESIDSGCNALILACDYFNIQTFFCCAGHPDSAYIGYDRHHPDTYKITNALLEHGWIMDRQKTDEPWCNRICMRMFKGFDNKDSVRRNKWIKLTDHLNKITDGYIESVVEKNILYYTIQYEGD